MRPSVTTKHSREQKSGSSNKLSGSAAATSNASHRLPETVLRCELCPIAQPHGDDSRVWVQWCPTFHQPALTHDVRQPRVTEEGGLAAIPLT